MILTDYTLGVLEDNTYQLTDPSIRNMIGIYYNTFHSSGISSQPFTLDLLYFASTILNPLFVNNIYILVTVILNFCTAYYLFVKFHEKKVSFLLALTYSFAPYILFKLQNHPTLLNVWIINFGLILIFQKINNFHRSILYGLFLAFAILSNNYYGYFIILITLIHTTIEIFNHLIKRQYSLGVRYFMRILISFIIFISIVGFTLYPYIKANYLNKENQYFEGSRSIVIDGKTQILRGSNWQITENSTRTTNQKMVSRRFEDFFDFSTRPWYYVLPPTNNILWGNISKEVIMWIQSKTWLGNNYFMREHSASYLGIVNIFLAIIGIGYLRKSSNRKSVYKVGLIGIIIFVLSLPPFITVSGYKIILPSIFLYFLFPMFRAISRFGMVTLPIFLLFTGYGYSFLLRKGKLAYIAYLLFIICLFDFVIPIKIISKYDQPYIFETLRNHLPEDAVLAFIPTEDSNTIMFNMSVFRRPYINPKGYVAPEFDFDADKFSDKLTTCAGILEARNLGVTHIIIFGRQDKPYLKENRTLLESTLISNYYAFPGTNTTIYKIKQNLQIQNEKEKCLHSIEMIK